MNRKIAIQGIQGSFHHQVALEYFGDTEVEECLSFDEVISAIHKKKAGAAVMAIENSIAGSIIPNYALIDANKLHIIGEHYLTIHHNLMAMPGQKIEEIKEVYSHPMALLQCKKFFEAYPHIKLVEDSDTAEVARRIHKGALKGIGAIASRVAADMYDLDILASEIQTIKDNQTRFVIVQPTNSVIPVEKINKASMKFELDHKRGSLATVLNVMSDCKLSLTKIQSLPKIETPWKYAFFVDVTFETYDHFKKAKSLLEIMAEDFRIHGEYINAKQ
ncbi:prephenate dehydratase [Robertkochia marina]|uniref:prephenate dehydratase n=1 Tax=Robertkochia marina TaxID=1227945 RepID=A0A4S3M3Q0_9FLAO|nr:prephenate dehydratase [Robertkochia marina]THD68911.1 prephenate dehydratase [Robertkochia marina]TRZ41155.1 prephenate dehydratase [Robertkochia marina]